MAIIYGLKVNLSVAMVAMLNHTALTQSHPHPVQVTLHNITTRVTDDACAAAAESSAAIEVNSIEMKYFYGENFYFNKFISSFFLFFIL